MKKSHFYKYSMVLKKTARFCVKLISVAMTFEAALGIHLANAADDNVAISSSLPTGRIQFDAAAVTNTIGILGGDAMVPLYGDKEGFIYGDLMGDYGSDVTYLTSPGAGFRSVSNNQIIGAYFFADHEKVSLGQDFWVLSPGLEWINSTWDAHVNGYFPTETNVQNGSSDFLSSFGDTSRVSFQEGTHNQYDELVTPFDNIGSGVDIECGYSFAGNHHVRSRVYLGGYYYQFPDDANVDNILGITAGFEQPVSKYLKVSLFNSYDQVSNYNVGVSLTVTLGGESNLYSTDVHDRLLDPIQRHVGIIDTGAGTYDQQSFENEGTGLAYNNVYFVSDSGTEDADGTYGDPMLLDQTALNTIDTESPTGSRIYIQGGNDAVYTINSSTGSTESVDGTPVSGLFVYDNQDFYGRTANYTAPAIGNDRPQIITDETGGYNGFVIVNNQENTFSDLSLSADTTGNNTTGILVYNNISDDSVLTIENISVTQFSTGVYGSNSNTGNLIINVNNSTFSNNSAVSGYAPNAYGIRVLNSNSGDLIVNASDSQFNNNVATGLSGSSFGFYGANSGSGALTLNVTNSQFNGNSAAGDSASAYGVDVFNSSSGTITVNAVNSQFNDNTASGSSGSPMGVGLYAINTGSGDIEINAIDSQFNGNTANGPDSVPAGLEVFNLNSGNVDINAVNSSFNDNVASGSGTPIGFGIYGNNADSGNLTISATDSTFNNNTSTGLYVRNSGTGLLTVSDLSGSSFYYNGDYGIYGSAAHPGYTTINIANTSIFGNSIGNTGSNGNVVFE